MLNERLDQYLSEDIYPFHMPGHKRNRTLRADIPYQRDITEIPGFDNLNDPREILADLETEIARIYDVADAVISVNGSTNGILAAIRALSYENKNILVQRSCHKSVYNAIELNSLDADYIPVVLNDISAIVDINIDVFENQIKTKDYSAVVITSPSYEGYYLDLARIYSLCRESNTKLILDMAHGSHSILDGRYSKSFDIAITSFHKNLQALTSSAAVLINDRDLSKEIRRNMAIFQTSSPSYITLASIDDMLRNFDQYDLLQTKLETNLDRLYKLNLKHLSLLKDKYKDKSKLVVSTLDANISGEELASLLREEKIEVEMAYPGYALLISTIFDTDEGFDRLKNALEKIDKTLKEDTKTLNFYYATPKKLYTIEKAATSPKKSIKSDQALYKISGQYVYAYPPGIPILAPGELIDSEVMANIHFLKNNGISLNIEDNIDIID